jgi:transketolase
VIRPCDANETAEAWRAAIELQDKPVALILSRQDLPTLDRTKFNSANQLHYGAYILHDMPDPELILIASGSEVNLIVQAQEELLKNKISVRLVSMPSWELFETQSDDYKNSVLPASVKLKIAVEAGSTQGWEKYAGDSGLVIGIDCFGSSAPGEVTMREYGFTVEHICTKAIALLKKNGHE